MGFKPSCLPSPKNNNKETHTNYQDTGKGMHFLLTANRLDAVTLLLASKLEARKGEVTVIRLYACSVPLSKEGRI